MAKRILAYILIAIGTIIGIALLLNLVMPLVVGGRQVTVPDIRGLGEEDAAATLRQTGLKHEIGEDVFSVEYPESTVASQDPLPGAVVKQGRKVVLTMSLGGEFQGVPYCIGKPFRTARIMLERAGFIIGYVTRAPSLRGYPEEVLSTEPLPGTEVVRGSLVNILVNAGPRPARVLLPDLKDEPYLTVKMRLERLGLFVRQTSVDDDFVPVRSRVVMHDPPAGYIVSRGDTVTLIISSEKREGRSL
jgi:beta-lactam-binding protein with PASTA domain